MGGDAILHHPGNSTRFDYISRVFSAGHHSKSTRLRFICEQHAAIIGIECGGNLSKWGCSGTQSL